MTTSRSLLLAVKSSGAQPAQHLGPYGVAVAVFQWVWGHSLLGVSDNVPIESCGPVLMFAFVAKNQVVIKMLAIGLASSVLLDATIVRLLAVPAVMYLLGRSSWWLPRCLDPVLPHIDVEGEEQPATAGPVESGAVG